MAIRSGQILKKYQGLWVVSREANIVQAAAEELLRIVEPQFELIKSLAKDMQGQMSVGIWWEPKEGQGGFTVASEVMKRLVNLCERIDIYFPG